MTQEQLIERINNEIDGLNSEKDSQELRSFLTTDAQARELFEQMEAVARFLNRAEHLHPPPSLKRRILNSTLYREKATTWRERIATAMARGFVPQLAFAFVAGLVIGVAGYATVVSLEGSHPFDWSTASGALTSSTSSAPLVERSLDIPEWKLRGTLKMHASGSLLTADFDYAAGVPLTAEFALDPEQLLFKGFARNSHQPGDVQMGRDVVRFTLNGENVYRLLFSWGSASGSRLILRVYHGDATLLAEEFWINSGRK